MIIYRKRIHDMMKLSLKKGGLKFRDGIEQKMKRT